jgi:hypothetical protein
MRALLGDGLGHALEPLGVGGHVLQFGDAQLEKLGSILLNQLGRNLQSILKIDKV